jgi:F-type H+-transporting ATPase subunit b
MEALSLLGIDPWSVLVYMVNFGLILFVVWKFFTNPIIATLDKRKNQIENNIKEADKLKNELSKQKEIMEKEKEELKQRMESEIVSLKKNLENKRKEAEAEIDLRRAKMLEEVKKTITEEKAAIKNDIKDEILEIVQKMVLYIVSNKMPKDIVSASVKEAWDTYKQ